MQMLINAIATSCSVTGKRDEKLSNLDPNPAAIFF